MLPLDQLTSSPFPLLPPHSTRISISQAALSPGPDRTATTAHYCPDSKGEIIPSNHHLHDPRRPQGPCPLHRQRQQRQQQQQWSARV